MLGLSVAEREGLIEKALAEKFGKWWTWEKPVLVPSIGPTDPNAYDAFAAHLIDLHAQARKQLEALDDDALRSLQDHNGDTSENFLAWFNRLLRDDINKLPLREPVWLVAGFGHPAARANCRHWAQMADYSLHEALLLSVGVEPKLLPEHLFQDQRRDAGVATSNQFVFLKNRLAVLKGHFPHSSWDGTSLRVSSVWLKDLIDRIELDVDAEFMTYLSRRVARDRGEEPTPPKRLAQSELESLLKLVAGMAIEQYGYDPASSRNQAIPNIADDLDRLGIGLDLKTIRKWLKEACKTVRPEKPD